MRYSKLHSGYRLRLGDQIPTRPTTIARIMADPKFALGVADARAGRGYPANYDTWREGQWSYERGRQWAQIAPRSLPLKMDGQINPRALLWFRKHADDIL
jgi:hypothetical protein